jgi:hypothetical protein
MGAEIPRYRREKLWRYSVSFGFGGTGDSIRCGVYVPLGLDDLAEAIEHAIVVLGARDGDSALKLTAEKVVSPKSGDISDRVLTLAS